MYTRVFCKCSHKPFLSSLLESVNFAFVFAEKLKLSQNSAEEGDKQRKSLEAENARLKKELDDKELEVDQLNATIRMFHPCCNGARSLIKLYLVILHLWKMLV